MATTCSTNVQRQATTFKYKISTVRVTKPMTNPQKTSRMLMGPERGLKPCKLHDDVDDDEKEAIPVQ